MAPASAVASYPPPGPSTFQPHARRLSTFAEENFANNVFSRQATHRRSSSGKLSAVDTSNISSVVYSLKRRSSIEIGSDTSARLLSTTHDSILEWIRTQRMSQLPAEGSSYDKVLSWAQLFVERLHSFEVAIEEFAGDSYLAAQLAYGYCVLLLEVRPCSHGPLGIERILTYVIIAGQRECFCADDLLWPLL